MTGNGRGQIQYDFVVGVSILVMTIVVAFTFVPGLFGGVTEGRVQGDQVTADRVAAWLTEGGLGDPSSPGEVDTDCTRALFDTGVDHCGFDGATFDDNLFVDDRYVNVSVLNGSRRVCLNTGSGELGRAGGSFTSDCSDSDEFMFTGGGSPGGSSTVSTATRPISIDGYQAEIVVRVW